MAKTPTPWQPSQNPIDCSQTVCTHFFPPPAFAVGGDDSDDGSATASGTAISPVIIAIIAAVVAALLLLLSYLFLSRRRRSRLRLRPDSSSPSPASAAGEIEGAAREARREPEGLDETLISRIAACKYRRSEGLVGGTDCTVCLTEFQEGESLRLLPECGHAFHVPCIDTWLKNHSNCPICRAGIVWMGPVEERVVVVDRNSGRGRGGN